MLHIIRTLRRRNAHWRLAIRTAEALVAIHGRAGADRAYAEAMRAEGNPRVGDEERGHLRLVATIARERYLELMRTAPEERTGIYIRWLERRGQMISTLLAEADGRA